MMTTMMCILCYVECHSVIYSCSLCTISQQVLSSTVMTCFQDRIRNTSLQFRGHNQRVQTEKLSRSGASPATFTLSHRTADRLSDVNDEVEEQCWIINMKINTDSRRNLQRLPVLHRCCRTSNTEDVLWSVRPGGCLSYRLTWLSRLSRDWRKGRLQRVGGGVLFLRDRLLCRQ